MNLYMCADLIYLELNLRRKIMDAFLVEYKCVIISVAPCLRVGQCCKKQVANGILLSARRY